jgi:hypothetical protein
MIRVNAERLTPAPADAVYALLADYQQGHPSILPPEFSDFAVLEGGTGAGTVIRYRVRLGGRTLGATARVAEPEPGRVLTETDVNTGAVTTFIVVPAGEQTRLQFETAWEPSRGIVGIVERLAAPRMLRRLYDKEFDRIERWAISMRQPIS